MLYIYHQVKGNHEGVIEKVKQQLEKGAELMRLLVQCINLKCLLPVCKIAAFTDSSVPSKDDPSYFRFNKDRIEDFGPQLQVVIQKLHERVSSVIQIGLIRSNLGLSVYHFRSIEKQCPFSIFL